MRTRVGEVCGQPAPVDQQMTQIPVVIGKCLHNRLETGDVSSQPLHGPICHDVVRDEVAQLGEAVLVAPPQVVEVEVAERLVHKGAPKEIASLSSTEPNISVQRDQHQERRAQCLRPTCANTRWPGDASPLRR